MSIIRVHVALPGERSHQGDARRPSSGWPARESWSRKYVDSVLTEGCPMASPTSTACAIAVAISAVSVMGVSGTKYTPSSNRSRSAAAACTARRVLPVPPGPVRVSRRYAGEVWLSSRVTSASIRSRPMKLVNCSGRLSGRRTLRRIIHPRLGLIQPMGPAFQTAWRSPGTTGTGVDSTPRPIYAARP